MADQIALEFVPLVEQFLERVRQLARDAEQALLPLGRGQELRLDLSQAEGELTALRDQLLGLGSAPVFVRFDESQAEAAVAALQERLVALREVAAVAVDPGPAVAGLEEIATTAGGVAAGLAAVGAAAAEVGPEVAAGTAEATPGLANVSAAAYRAALAVDAFARQAAVASEVTPSLNLSAGRAAVALEELDAAMRHTAAAGGPISPQQLATLQALVASLQAAQAQVNALAGAQQQQAGAAGAAAGATTAAGTAAAGAGAAAAGAAGGIGALNTAMSTLVSTTAFYLGMRIARFFAELVGGSLNAKEAMERVNAELERSRGAGAAAGVELALLRDTADKLGLNFQQVAEHYGKFTDTLKGSDVPVRTQQNLLLGTAAALAALRRPAEDAGQVFEIFSRLAARDETQVRQLASALNTIIPGSMRIAAAALFQGEDSLARFEAAAKKGQVSSHDFLEVIGPAYIRQFQDQLPGAVDSTTAALNRLKNAEFEAQVGLGEGFAPEVHRATEEFRAFLATAGDTPRAIGEVVSAFIWLGTKAGELVGSVVKFIGAVASEVLTVLPALLGAVSAGLEKLAAAVHLDAVAAGLRDAKENFLAAGHAFEDEAGRMTDQSQALWASFVSGEPASRQAGAALDLLASHGKDFEHGLNEQVAAIERQVAAIERQADALGRTGPVAREAADDLVKSIDKELKAIAELPPAEQKALSGRKATLDQLRVHYEQFTTAYLRLQEQQAKAAEAEAAREAAALKRREDAILAFFAKIQAVEDKAGQESVKKAEALRAQIQKGQERINELRDKPLRTVDEENELSGLSTSIRDSEEQLRRLIDSEAAAGRSAALFGSEAERAGEQFRESLQKDIATNEQLRASLGRLPETAKASFGGILQNLVDLKSQGRLTQDELARGLGQLGKILVDGGAASKGLEERLGLATHAAESLAVGVAKIKAPAADSASALERLAAAADRLPAAADRLAEVGAPSPGGRRRRSTSTEQRREEEAAAGAAGGPRGPSEISIRPSAASQPPTEQAERDVTRQKANTDGVVDSLKREKAAEGEVAKETGIVRDEIVKLDHGTIELKKHTDEQAGSAQRAGAAAEGQAAGVNKAMQAMLHMQEEQKAAEGQTAKTTTEVVKLGGGMVELRQKTEGAAGSVAAAGEEAKKSTVSVESLGGGFVELKQRVEELPEPIQKTVGHTRDLKEAVTEAGMAGDQAGAGFIKMGDTVFGLAPKLKDAGDQAQKTGDTVAGAGTAADNASAGFVKVGGAVITLAPGLKNVGNEAQKAGEILDKASVSAGSASGKLDEVGPAAAAAGEAAGTAAPGFQVLAGSLSTIATSGAGAPAVLQSIGTLLGLIAGTGADRVLQGIASALVQVGPDGRSAAEGVKSLLAEVKKDLASLRAFAVELRAAHEAAAALAVDLQKNVTLCQQLKECTDALKEA